MMDDPNDDSEKAQSVRRLNGIAKVLKQRRIDAGALTLASPEVRFDLDPDTHNPTDVQLYALKETNSLVEEFMLLANITVAKKILATFPTCSLLRRHPAPSRRQFDSLVKSAASVSVEIKCSTSKVRADGAASSRAAVVGGGAGFVGFGAGACRGAAAGCGGGVVACRWCAGAVSVGRDDWFCCLA